MSYAIGLAAGLAIGLVWGLRLGIRLGQQETIARMEDILGIGPGVPAGHQTKKPRGRGGKA